MITSTDLSFYVSFLKKKKKKKGKSEFPSTVLKKINIIYDKGKNNKKIVNNLCTLDSVLWETREFKNFIKHLCWVNVSQSETLFHFHLQNMVQDHCKINVSFNTYIIWRKLPKLVVIIGNQGSLYNN